MLFWNLLLYVAGAFLALRSLISLMAQHKHHYEHKLRRQMAREARQNAEPPAKQAKAPAA